MRPGSSLTFWTGNIPDTFSFLFLRFAEPRTRPADLPPSFPRLRERLYDWDTAIRGSRAAEWVADFVRRGGGEAGLVETETFPLAVGEIPATSGGDAPTVLVYGHFDVQPPAPLELWESEPFEATIRDEWLYARGVADDKGQLWMLLHAAGLLAAEGALPINIRVASDGEEEVGGQSIVQFLEQDERGADACVIFDGAMERRDLPAISVATRRSVILSTGFVGVSRNSIFVFAWNARSSSMGCEVST